jgi:coenzyme F420-reducing hydrogenase gamma subunit
MKISVFQFGGCDKCFGQTILLKDAKNKEKMDIEWVKEPKQWKPQKLDYAVITGYLTAENKQSVQQILENAKKVIGFGSCSVMGGVYGLSYQRGNLIKPLRFFSKEVAEIPACMGEIEELMEYLEKGDLSEKKALCSVCSRKSTCSFLSDVLRQIDLAQDETSCLNDLGFMCNGYVAKECKERCIAHGAPCRGCKPSVDRSGMRMLGMFGTLMGNIEVATEATGKGGTDKLADRDDDVTKSVPDVAGNFFRFTLADGLLPVGRIKSTGSIISDIFMSRLIEELPLISGLIGGYHAAELTLDIIEAYENGVGIQTAETTKKLRSELLKAENKLRNSLKEQKTQEYREAESEIRKIAGNMNLSNVFFGGFKTAIDGYDNFEEYKYALFENTAGQYTGKYVKYSINEMGQVISFDFSPEFKKMEGI